MSYRRFNGPSVLGKQDFNGRPALASTEYSVSLVVIVVVVLLLRRRRRRRRRSRVRILRVNVLVRFCARDHLSAVQVLTFFSLRSGSG